MANQTNNNNYVGSLWKKVSEKTGKKYLTGYIEVGGEKINVVAFVNQPEDKKSEKSPDIVIMEQVPLEDNGGGNGGSRRDGGSRAPQRSAPARSAPRSTPSRGGGRAAPARNRGDGDGGGEDNIF